MDAFGSHTITIVRRPAPDRHGDPTGDPTETEVEGCYVQPRGPAGGTSSEQLGQRDTVTTGLIAFVPAGADIAATDQIRWNGEVYQVDGDPAPWSLPEGTVHHLEVVLQLVKG